MRLIPPHLSENFTKGLPYFFDYGVPCCRIPGVDYENDPAVNFPRDLHIRVGKGTAESGAFHQDPLAFEQNKDRVRLVPYRTDAGVDINVIRLEGDHDERIGGAMLLKVLDQVTTWASGQGIRATLVFSPRDEVQAQWYFNFGLRGVLSFTAHNEGSAALEVAVREKLIKVAYYRDAVDGQGGGSRIIDSIPFNFEYNKWYELVVRLIPIADELNTWDVKVKLTALHDPAQRIIYRAPAEKRPNRIVTVEHLAFGDEHMGLPDGGVFYFSHLSAVTIPPL